MKTHVGQLQAHGPGGWALNRRSSASAEPRCSCKREVQLERALLPGAGVLQVPCTYTSIVAAGSQGSTPVHVNLRRSSHLRKSPEESRLQGEVGIEPWRSAGCSEIELTQAGEKRQSTTAGLAGREHASMRGRVSHNEGGPCIPCKQWAFIQVAAGALKVHHRGVLSCAILRAISDDVRSPFTSPQWALRLHYLFAQCSFCRLPSAT